MPGGVGEAWDRELRVSLLSFEKARPHTAIQLQKQAIKMEAPTKGGYRFMPAGKT